MSVSFFLATLCFLFLRKSSKIFSKLQDILFSFNLKTRPSCHTLSDYSDISRNTPWIIWWDEIQWIIRNNCLKQFLAGEIRPFGIRQRIMKQAVITFTTCRQQGNRIVIFHRLFIIFLMYWDNIRFLPLPWKLFPF